MSRLRSIKQGVMITLEKIFLPWRYWRQYYIDEMVATYHPEFGSFWQPKESGGLYLQQAQDVGYKQGYEDAVEKVVSEYAALLVPPVAQEFEWTMTTLYGRDTHEGNLFEIISKFGKKGWTPVVCIHSQDWATEFNGIKTGPNPQDKVVIYFRKVKGGSHEETS